MVDVSVVVPCFDCEAYLAEAVATALSQTNVVIEVILVDDGSTDATADVMARLAGADSRIRLDACPSNLGPAAARNRAFALARGEWIALLDADDFYQPGRLEKLVRLGRLHRADVVADDLLLRDHAGAEPDTPARILAGGAGFVGTERFFAAAVPRAASCDIGYMHPIIRRAFVAHKGIGYQEDLRSGSDFVYYAQLVMAGARLYYFPEPGYVYRRTPTSVTSDPTRNTPILLEGTDRLLREGSGLLPPVSVVALRRRKRLHVRRQNWRDLRTLRRASLICFLVAALCSPRKALDFVIERRAVP